MDHAKRFASVIVTLLTFAGGPAAHAAQVEPASAAAAATRPDFSGTWTIDRSISTEPAQIDLAPAAGNRRQSRGGFSGGFGGFGRAGGRSRPGNASGGESGSEPLTPVERERLKALTDQIKTASATIVISHHDPDFVVSDAQNHAWFLHTNGASDDNHLGADTVTTTTHWEESRIVAEYALSSRLTIVYTYTLLPKTRQLVIRIARKTQGRASSAQEVRLVYNPAA